MENYSVFQRKLLYIQVTVKYCISNIEKKNIIIQLFYSSILLKTRTFCLFNQISTFPASWNTKKKNTRISSLLKKRKLRKRLRTDMSTAKARNADNANDALTWICKNTPTYYILTKRSTAWNHCRRKSAAAAATHSPLCVAQLNNMIVQNAEKA